MGAIWRIEFLGWLRASVDDTVISRFETQRTAVLLAYLAIHRDRSHPKEVLIELLWPDSDPAVTRPRLNQALYSLRSHFESPNFPKGSVFVSDRHSIQMNPASATTDVDDFKRALKVVRSSAPHVDKIANLKYAMGLYRGELLPGFYDPWISTLRDELADRRVSGLKQLIAFSESAGNLLEALEASQQLAALEPLEEEHHVQVIRLQGLLGNTAAASRQFRLLERLLQEELGDFPTTATKNLIARIRSGPAPKGQARGQSGQAKTSFVSGKEVPTPRLPVQLTRFFGRPAEVEQATGLLLSGTTRLLTLLGPGGCGKTRLAIEVARKLAPGVTEAVGYVPLADLARADQVPEAVLRSLRREIRGTEAPQVQAIEALFADSVKLLVFDNFEHVIDGGAELVGALLRQLPDLWIIVTSRTRLNVQGEQLLAVDPLPLPSSTTDSDESPTAPSVELFVDRAQTVRADFRVNVENRASICEVCVRLEGIPLAIELAAALLQTMSLSQVLTGIEQRFALLVSRRRDLSDRHRSLRAALDYGFQMLPKEIQSFFAKLSVFRGGWTAAAATYVCAEPYAVEYMAQLVERSLVQVDDTSVSDTSRYTMLETLREYGWNQLTGDDRTVAQGEHAVYFSDFAENAARFTTGPESVLWLRLLDEDRGNMMNAMSWCMRASLARTGLRIAGNLLAYWEAKGSQTEGREFLRRLLAIEDSTVSPSGRALALSTLGRLAWDQADSLESRAAHQEALQIYERVNDLSGVAEELYSLGIVAYQLEEGTAAQDLVERSLVLSQDLCDRSGIAKALLVLGNLATGRLEFNTARRFYEQAFELEQSLGNVIRVISALNNLGDLAYHQGNYELARRYFEDCLAQFSTVEDVKRRAIALNNLGIVLGRSGRFASAAPYSAEALRTSQAVGLHSEARSALSNLVWLAGQTGDGEATATMSGIIDRLNESIPSPLTPEELESMTESEATACSAITAKAFESARLYGRSLYGVRGWEYALNWAKANGQPAEAVAPSGPS